LIEEDGEEERETEGEETQFAQRNSGTMQITKIFSSFN